MPQSYPPPRNWHAVLQRYPPDTCNGQTDPVIVSCIGDVRAPGCTIVYADPGRRYNWAVLLGLYVAIAVEPGINVREFVCALDAIVRPCLTIWEPSSNRRLSIISTRPMRGITETPRASV